jgi:hypothetical protein
MTRRTRAVVFFAGVALAVLYFLRGPTVIELLVNRGWAAGVSIAASLLSALAAAAVTSSLVMRKRSLMKEPGPRLLKVPK